MEIFNIQKFNLFFQTPARVVAPPPWVEHIPFAFFIVELLRPQTIVELGVHTGNSYNAFCQAVQALSLPSKCYGVDTWQGEEHAGFYEENVFQDLNNYQQKHYAGFSSLLRCTFDQALDQFADKSIDLLHIDGLHTYEAVKHDYETWLPKVREGGVILFHDTQVFQKNFGVWELWKELSHHYQTYEFKHCNGLGVVLVGTNPSVEAFLRAAQESPFIQGLFPALGRTISLMETSQEKEAELQHQLENIRHESVLLQKTIAEQQTEIGRLHERIISLGIKNRIKRFFFR